MQFINTTKGFTLIEMVVALALFASVATMSIGTLLVLVDSNRELRDEQSLITNASFALDMMSRDIRTGYDYICDTQATGSPTNSIYGSGHNSLTELADCTNGKGGGGAISLRHGISFIPGEARIIGSADRVAYYYDRQEQTIMRRIGTSAPQSILSSSVRLLDADFYVTGTTKVSGGVQDIEQPTVTIVLEVAGDDGQSYTLQTTVTQRFLDI